MINAEQECGGEGGDKEAVAFWKARTVGGAGQPGTPTDSGEMDAETNGQKGDADEAEETEGVKIAQPRHCLGGDGALAAREGLAGEFGGVDTGDGGAKRNDQTERARERDGEREGRCGGGIGGPETHGMARRRTTCLRR